jgi:hypothetical protein
MNIFKVMLLPAIFFSFGSAHADTFTYDFSSSFFNVSFSSQPSVITNDTIIQVGSLLTNTTPDLQSVEINPTSYFCGGNLFPIPDASSCIFFSQPSQGTGYFFSSQLTTPGRYVSGNAVLTITQSTSSSPVPEPSSLALLTTGASGIAMMGLRRLRTRRWA